MQINLVFFPYGDDDVDDNKEDNDHKDSKNDDSKHISYHIPGTLLNDLNILS